MYRPYNLIAAIQAISEEFALLKVKFAINAKTHGFRGALFSVRTM